MQAEDSEKELIAKMWSFLALAFVLFVIVPLIAILIESEKG